MTLGHVYDLDLKKNEQVIKDVIIQAQGEMALEEFIKQVCFLLVDFRAMLMFYRFAKLGPAILSIW